MRPLRRLLSAILLASFLASTLSIAFDAHALADLIAADRGAADAGLAAPDGDQHHSLPAGQDCNHGCHVLNHLLGQVPASPAMLVLPHSVCSLVQADTAAPSHLVELPYRPPLLASQI